MKLNWSSALAAGAFMGASLPLLVAADAVPGVPVSVLVTVESKGSALPVLTKEDVRVEENRHQRALTDIRHLEAGRTQMLLLIDDSAGSSFDVQISDLKKFVMALPPETEIGVGYMHNGMSEMTSDFTKDHAKAAASIRVTEGPGGADVSPYDSLAEAAKKWPKDDGVTRREVVMISSGLEGLGGGLPPENPYVNTGISAAQKAGLVVYAIYNPAFGHAGHSLWRSTLGQDFLSQVADETGGELYTVGFGASVSFQPYLSDIIKRQSEQYILTFEADAEKKAGLQSIKVASTQKGVSIAAPDKVFVKASL